MVPVWFSQVLRLQMTERSLSHMLNLVRFFRLYCTTEFESQCDESAVAAMQRHCLISPLHCPFRHLGSTQELRMAQSCLNHTAAPKNIVAPPCCLSVLCRRWGMTSSSISPYLHCSCYLSCSVHPRSSTGSATWGTLVCEVQIKHLLNMLKPIQKNNYCYLHAG